MGRVGVFWQPMLPPLQQERKKTQETLDFASASKILAMKKKQTKKKTQINSDRRQSAYKSHSLFRSRVFLFKLKTRYCVKYVN